MAKFPNEVARFRRVVGRDLALGEPGDIILPSDHNELADEVEAIENELINGNTFKPIVNNSEYNLYEKINIKLDRTDQDLDVQIHNPQIFQENIYFVSDGKICLKKIENLEETINSEIQTQNFTMNERVIIVPKEGTNNFNIHDRKTFQKIDEIQLNEYYDLFFLSKNFFCIMNYTIRLLKIIFLDTKEIISQQQFTSNTSGATYSCGKIFFNYLTKTFNTKNGQWENLPTYCGRYFHAGHFLWGPRYQLDPRVAEIHPDSLTYNITGQYGLLEPIGTIGQKLFFFSNIPQRLGFLTRYNAYGEIDYIQKGNNDRAFIVQNVLVIQEQNTTRTKTIPLFF